MTRHYASDAEALEAIHCELNETRTHGRRSEMKAALNRAIDRVRADTALVEAAREVLAARPVCPISDSHREREAIESLRSALEAAEPPEET